MKQQSRLQAKKLLMVFVQLAILWHASTAFSYPVTFQDARGNTITIKNRPSKVVSLVPSISEILFKIGAGDAVKGITYHTNYPTETSDKTIIGGFSNPSASRIETLQPDIIFYSRVHEKVRERFRHGECQLIQLSMNSIDDSLKNILLLGRMFNREKEAATITDKITTELETIEKKVALIPYSKQKRVVRFMGLDPLTIPGDDSFQNGFIKSAGGIPPVFNKSGNIVTISQEEWVRFNPQVIYGCGVELETAKKFFNHQGWKDVEAVQKGNIFIFPCDLTCRAATNTGTFVSRLAAKIYREEFSKKEKQVFPDKVIESRKLYIDLDYIKHARIATSHMHDFINKTLIIDFREPLSVVSTLEGQREGIETVGNHYTPPPCWGLGHGLPLTDILSPLYDVIGKSAQTSGFLLTGADMDNLAVVNKKFKEMEVVALVTAGVATNACRMSRDQGKYYEPGTINIILLTNMALTKRAMTRAIITATEAKTAVLLDLDVRSSYTPKNYRATGTGTDNIIVVQGTGIEIDNAGGHTKMGELISRAVYDGVLKAIRNQNGLTVSRNIFQRLKERGITPLGMVSQISRECSININDQVVALEEILLEPRYAGFVESSLALSDDIEKGLCTDLEAYDVWCKIIAEEIAGRKITSFKNLVKITDLPDGLRRALNALMNGLYYKTR